MQISTTFNYKLIPNGDIESFFWSDPVGSPTINIEIKPAYVAVFPLDELEEGDHVRAAEVVGRLQSREKAPPRQPLEVVLADVLKKLMKSSELLSK